MTHASTLFRGQDVTNFLPRPDVVLMADVVYYEEVWLACFISLHMAFDCCGTAKVE